MLSTVTLGDLGDLRAGFNAAVSGAAGSRRRGRLTWICTDLRLQPARVAATGRGPATRAASSMAAANLAAAADSRPKRSVARTLSACAVPLAEGAPRLVSDASGCRAGEKGGPRGGLPGGRSAGAPGGGRAGAGAGRPRRVAPASGPRALGTGRSAQLAALFPRADTFGVFGFCFFLSVGLLSLREMWFRWTHFERVGGLMWSLLTRTLTLENTRP